MLASNYRSICKATCGTSLQQSRPEQPAFVLFTVSRRSLQNLTSTLLLSSVLQIRALAFKASSAASFFAMTFSVSHYEYRRQQPPARVGAGGGGGASGNWKYYVVAGFGGAALLVVFLTTCLWLRHRKRKNYKPSEFMENTGQAWKLEDQLPSNPTPGDAMASGAKPPGKTSYGGPAGHDAGPEQEQGLLAHAADAGKHSSIGNHSLAPGGSGNFYAQPNMNASTSSFHTPSATPPIRPNSFSYPPVATNPAYDGSHWNTPQGPTGHSFQAGPSNSHPSPYFSAQNQPPISSPPIMLTQSPPPQYASRPPTVETYPPQQQQYQQQPYQQQQLPPKPQFQSFGPPPPSASAHPPGLMPGQRPQSLSAQPPLPLYLQQTHGSGGQADSYFSGAHIGTTVRRDRGLSVDGGRRGQSVDAGRGGVITPLGNEERLRRLSVQTGERRGRSMDRGGVGHPVGGRFHELDSAGGDLGGRGRGWDR